MAFYLGDASGSTHTIEIRALQSVHSGYSDETSVVDILAPETGKDISTKALSLGRGDILTLPETTASWTLYNLNGAVIAAGTTPAVDTAPLTPGHYLLTTGASTLRLVIRP